jgi:16S rRNA (cytosine967-C5)-methyltransferase
MSLRVNRLKYSREAYLDLLHHAHIDAHPLSETMAGIQLAQACPVGQLPAFEQGAVSVQDGAAQLASELLDARPEHRVLDACAAPGGKTAHLLELTPSLSELTALDVQPDRCEKLHQTLARLELSANVVCADARYPGNWHSGELFDRILIDAPCTATGVIRRHPDIKLLRQSTDLDSITQIQRQLLDALWPLLKPSGQMLYTTCSILKAENQHQIEAFMTRHPDARESKISIDWGIACSAGRQRLPGEQGMDGFYYARLIKAA